MKAFPFKKYFFIECDVYDVYYNIETILIVIGSVVYLIFKNFRIGFSDEIPHFE